MRWFVYILWNAISWTVIHWKRNMKRWPSWYKIISNPPFSSTQYNNILVNAVVQYKHIFLNGNLYECIGEKLQLPSNYIVSLFRLFSSVLSCSSFISTYILLIHIFNLYTQFSPVSIHPHVYDMHRSNTDTSEMYHLLLKTSPNFCIKR